MKFNKIPISIIKESAPWAKDMVDIAMLLGKIIAKNLDFKFKNMNIRSPLDLFLKINSEIIGNYEKISRKKIAQKSSKNNNFPDINNITSRVVTLFNNEYRFVSQNSESFKNIDVDLGVPPNFNPFNENYSMEDLNKQLESSIYDFIVRFFIFLFQR